MKELRGKVALVTGASRGIGPYIARALAREGADVAVAARSAAELEAVAGKLREAGVRSIAVPADVSTAEGRAQLVERVTSELGPLAILVNNAGIERTAVYETQDPAEIASVIETNLVAPMLLSRAVLPAMLERREGHIVNVASLAGKVAVAFDAPYSASKAGLIQFTESIRSEYQGRGVSASVICPGFVADVGMYADAVTETGVTASRLAGTSKPAAVARAVVRSIKRDIPEIIVNPGPMRLATAFAELSPRGFERVYGLFQTRKHFAEVARQRGTGGGR